MEAPSNLARVLRVLVLLLALAAAAWTVSFWRTSAWAALGGWLAILTGLALVLGAEFLALAVAGRRDPAPRPSGWQLLAAWWRSIWLNAIVFGWWQPFRWRAIPDRIPSAPTAPPRRGVLLVHGFVCNRGFWMPWLKLLRGRGVPFIAVNLEPAFGSIDEYLATIDAAVQRLTRATGLPPLVVAHSMGGVAVRAWLRSGGAVQRVHHVVTIGSPHRGTWIGRFSRALNGRQLRVDSPWLRELAHARPEGAATAFTCWYSNCDNMVFPVSTATLPGADNRFVAGAGHLALAYHPDVIAASLALLER